MKILLLLCLLSLVVVVVSQWQRRSGDRTKKLSRRIQLRGVRSQPNNNWHGHRLRRSSGRRNQRARIRRNPWQHYRQQQMIHGHTTDGDVIGDYFIMTTTTDYSPSSSSPAYGHYWGHHRWTQHRINWYTTSRRGGDLIGDSVMMPTTTTTHWTTTTSSSSPAYGHGHHWRSSRQNRGSHNGINWYRTSIRGHGEIIVDYVMMPTTATTHWTTTHGTTTTSAYGYGYHWEHHGWAPDLRYWHFTTIMRYTTTPTTTTTTTTTAATTTTRPSVPNESAYLPRVEQRISTSTSSSSYGDTTTRPLYILPPEEIIYESVYRTYMEGRIPTSTSSSSYGHTTTTPLIEIITESVNRVRITDFMERISSSYGGSYVQTTRMWPRSSPRPTTDPHQNDVCEFKLGDGNGEGGTEFWAGKLRPAACARECMRRRKRNHRINGACTNASGYAACWCEVGMTHWSRSTYYKTCMFPPPCSKEAAAYGKRDTPRRRRRRHI